MGKTTYTKLDDNNIAVMEIVENRNIINKETLLKQKREMENNFNEQMEIVNEALAEFTK